MRITIDSESLFCQFLSYLGGWDDRVRNSRMRAHWIASTGKLVDTEIIALDQLAMALYEAPIGLWHAIIASPTDKSLTKDYPDVRRALKSCEVLRPRFLKVMKVEAVRLKALKSSLTVMPLKKGMRVVEKFLESKRNDDIVIKVMFASASKFRSWAHSHDVVAILKEDDLAPDAVFTFLLSEYVYAAMEVSPTVKARMKSALEKLPRLLARTVTREKGVFTDALLRKLFVAGVAWYGPLPALVLGDTQSRRKTNGSNKDPLRNAQRDIARALDADVRARFAGKITLAEYLDRFEKEVSRLAV